MGYQPSYGFLKDCLYRSESYKVTLADAYKKTDSSTHAGTIKMLDGDRPIPADFNGRNAII